MFKFLLNAIPRPWLITISQWVLPLISLWYRGKNYTDPISGEHFRRFLPYGYSKLRENALSPGTLSLERHRLLWLYLQRHTNFFTKEQTQSLLHIAPEQCFVKRFRQMKKLQYISTDLVSPLADVKADICSLPFEQNSFDVVMCNHVLEHIPDHTRAISELYRVMKPNGWGILQVPLDHHRSQTFSDDSITSKEERTRVFGQYDHLRIYGMDYFSLLERAGFKVEALPCTSIATAEEIRRYCLDAHEILPIVRKL